MKLILIWRRVLFTFILSILALAFFELFLSWIIQDDALFGRRLVPYELLTEYQINSLNTLIKGEPSYIKFSHKLGWTISENGKSRDGKYIANSTGIRSLREYDLYPPPGILRIAAFGDSYTHCDDVLNEDSWPYLLEKGNPKWEVLNFGVGGYGLDQAYLRWKTVREKFHPHIVLIGFWLRDINRVVNRFYPFYYESTGIPLGKPRFILRNGKLILIPNPISNPRDVLDATDNLSQIKNWGKKDFWFLQIAYSKSSLDKINTFKLIKNVIHRIKYRVLARKARYRKDQEPFLVTTALLKKFYEDVKVVNEIPIILIFPGKDDLYEFQKTKVKYWQPLIEFLNDNKLEYIDFMDSFEKYALENYIAVDRLFSGHYSAFGNKVVADILKDYISRKEEMIHAGD